MEQQTYFQPVIPEKPKRTVVKSTKKDVVFAVVLTLVSISACIFRFTSFALGFTLSYFLLFIVSTAYLIKKDVKLNFYGTACGILSLIASVVFTIYADRTMNGILFVVIIGLFSIYINSLAQSNKYQTYSYLSLLDIFKTIIINPIIYLLEPFRSFKEMNSKNNKNTKVLKILIGFGISIPILFVVIYYLAKSDVVFENILKTFFKNIINILSQIGTGLLLAPFLFSSLFAVNKKLGVQKHPKKLIKQKKIKFLDSTITNTVLVMLSIFYVIYLFSQLAYFFNAFSGMLPTGYEFTPAEYARRGFFEMAIIVIINLVVIGAFCVFTKTKNKKLPVLTKILATFINCFSIILIFTAMSKMLMYVNTFGLTRKRVLTSVAMVILTLITIFFTIKIFVPNFKYMHYIIICCTIFGLGVAYADIDTQIAKYNYNAYTTGKINNIDVSNFNVYYPSAMPYLAKLAENEDSNIKNEASYQMSYFDEYYVKTFNYNYTKKKANKIYKNFVNKFGEQFYNIGIKVERTDDWATKAFLYNYYSDYNYYDEEIKSSNLNIKDFRLNLRLDEADTFVANELSGEYYKINSLSMKNECIYIDLNKYKIEEGKSIIVLVYSNDGTIDKYNFTENYYFSDDYSSTVKLYFNKIYNENEINRVIIEMY